MKLYNKKLNEDITLLKAFHTKKDKRDFNLLKNEIMQRHDVSKATVYREMKKIRRGSISGRITIRPLIPLLSVIYGST